ncbi:class I SAM-dependent methyltransferase [Patescibacteria group bacterium]|nr:class I SAM-dependent methyltransferase [Patescibacteria group bacterium]
MKKNKHQFFKKILFPAYYLRRAILHPIRTTLYQAIKSSNAKLILDIGCGDGGLLDRLFDNNNIELIGVDSSPAIISRARKNRVHNHLFLADAEKLPFANEYFDAIIVSLILHGVDNIKGKQILGEAGRVLKKHGTIIVIDFSLPQNFIGKIIGFLFRQEEKIIGKNNPSHYKNYLEYLNRGGLSNIVRELNINILKNKKLFLGNFDVILMTKKPASDVNKNQLSIPSFTPLLNGVNKPWG